MGFSKNNVMTVLSANTVISKTATGKVDVQLGANPQVTLSVKKRVGLDNSFTPTLRAHRSGMELGVRYHRRISSHLSSYIGCSVNVEEIKQGIAMHMSMSAGLALKLTKYTKANYSLEVGDGEIRGVFGFTRGGLNIRLPIALSNIVSFSNVLLGGAAIALCAFATHQLHTYLYEDPLKANKQAKKKEQRAIEIEEGKRAAEEYAMMIRSKALQSALSEQERKGLVIVEAFYGKLSLLERMTIDTTVTSSEVFDVAAQLQVLVEHHRLVMPAMSKAAQYGFFNPCVQPGEALGLYVKFSFGGHVQSRLFQDTDPVSLPS